MNNIAASPPRSLRTLLTRIQGDSELSARQRTDCLSAVRRFSEITGRGLDIEATFQTLRPTLVSYRPPIGCAPKAWKKTWSNIRSNIQFVLRRYSCVANGKSECSQLGAAWSEFRKSIKKDAQIRALSRFINWCARLDIPPQAVDDVLLKKFKDFLEKETLLAKPSIVHRRTAVSWNAVLSENPLLGLNSLSPPCYRNTFSFPESAFPASFALELDEWVACVSGNDPLHPNAPLNPLREATWQHDRGTFVRAASALVRQGTSIDSISNLAALTEPRAVKTILQFYIDRLGEKTRGTDEVAKALFYLAKNWVHVPAPTLLELERLKNRVAIPSRGMSQRMKRRLQQFNCDQATAAIVNMPSRLLKEAEKTSDLRKAAYLTQTALLIELLLMAPMRLRNLVKVNVARHLLFISDRRGKCVLMIPSEEVKNNHPLTFEMSENTTHLLRHYLKSARPLLSTDINDYLFPGTKGGHKHAVSISEQISQNIWRCTGLTMNVHLFRHFAAKIYLNQHPGDYETVRQLLGHKSLQTTVDFYCEVDTARALKRHDEIVLKLRQPVRR